LATSRIEDSAGYLRAGDLAGTEVCAPEFLATGDVKDTHAAPHCRDVPDPVGDRRAAIDGPPGLRAERAVIGRMSQATRWSVCPRVVLAKESRDCHLDGAQRLTLRGPDCA
jgi:hypothetical protein